MPDEIVAIVIISILAGTFMSIIRMVLGYKERRLTSGKMGESSLTTSELERMMRRAVEEATEPLVRKIDDLEFELATRKEAPQLGEGRRDLLAGVDDEELHPENARVAERERS